MDFFINGYSGRMGKALQSYLECFPDKNAYDFKIISNEIGNQQRQVVVDFSRPASSIEAIKKCSRLSLPILIGTTGFTKEDFDKIISASELIPVLSEANFSLGIHQLLPNIREFVKNRSNDIQQISINEVHHREKADIPSGTAILIKNSIIQILEELNVQDINLDIISERNNQEFGLHRVTILLSNNNTIIFKHISDNRSIFVKGAIKSAIWLANQVPGHYRFKDFLQK